MTYEPFQAPVRVRPEVKGYDVRRYGLRQARPDDLAKLNRTYTSSVFRAIALQAARSKMVAVVDSRDFVLALAGLYPHPDHAEAFLWSNLRTGVDSGFPMVRALKLAMSAIPDDLPVIAYVRHNHVRGQKLARLLGFVADGPPVENLQRYRLQH